jgi:hypothetical protein
MSDLTPAALRWVYQHHGVITSAQLRTCDVARSTISRLVHAGVLRAAHKGVFVISSTPSTIEQRCVALCCAHRCGFVTGPTAGMMLGLRRMPRHAPLHFAVRHGLRLDFEPGVHYRQTTVLPAAHRTNRGHGIVTASYARLAFDLAADLTPLDHLSVLQQLLHEEKVSPNDLIAIDKRLGHPARPGSGLFRRNLERLDGTACSESHPEVLLAEALRRRGVPIELQTRLLRASNGRIARVDLAVPSIRWGIELDIHPEHRTVEGQAKGASRTRDLHVHDWQIEPVTELDMKELDLIADELCVLYHCRRRSHPRVS